MVAEDFTASEAEVIDLLRLRGRLSTQALCEELEVTTTAIRQRVERLLAREFVGRVATKHGRGRPRHVYYLTQKGQRYAGVNLADLAISAWEAIQEIGDDELRNRLVDDIFERMGRRYATEIDGAVPAERMESLARLFRARRIPYRVNSEGGLPVLTALACPYPGLAEDDRHICELERAMFSKLLDGDVQQSESRLDGAQCCTFRVKSH